MNWLVTLRKNVDLNEVRSAVKAVGGKIDQNFPSDMTVGEELIISVNAPENFPVKIKSAVKGIVEVYPNSDIMLYNNGI